MQAPDSAEELTTDWLLSESVRPTDSMLDMEHDSDSSSSSSQKLNRLVLLPESCCKVTFNMTGTYYDEYLLPIDGGWLSSAWTLWWHLLRLQFSWLFEALEHQGASSLMSLDFP